MPTRYRIVCHECEGTGSIDETLIRSSNEECYKCEGSGWYNKLLYSKYELTQAIQKEREACALECEQLAGSKGDDYYDDGIYACAEAIRNRK